ncbi:nucleoside triphosphate pyrophosphohydrolase [Clostridium isatidis]|uniref:nucleoside triphosphate pyrophosphohydrolase n=1 Tax=Clostridium isatidis TaxID=182773 RepID=UPI003AADD0EB
MIKIIGLGPGSPEALTIGAAKLLEKGENIYFRTKHHPIVNFLKDKIKNYETFDKYYENSENTDDINEKIANEILTAHKKTKDVVYGVPGNPLTAEKTVAILIKICKEKKIDYKVIPAVSFIDSLMEILKIDPIEGLMVIDASDINNQILDKRVATIIAQVYNKSVASKLKEKLLDSYNKQTEIYLIKNPGIDEAEIIRKIPVYELDKQEDLDNMTFIYVPKDKDNKKDFYDLVNLVETLRGENGCPWDREQTHQSIKNELIEETYELIEAIEENRIDGMIEELGDVLFHVVFHACIENENGNFNITDVINGIIAKMVYRHPHVFGEKEINNTDEVLKSWDELKKQEKKYETITEEMKSIAKTLPALTKAHKVQKKAAKVGFDWDSIEETSKKVIEELNEVLDVYKTKNGEKIKKEIGDLLFSCVNLSRKLNVNEEEALNMTINKFINRFSFVEEMALKNNKKLNDMTLEEMDKFWEIAKENEKNKK